MQKKRVVLTATVLLALHSTLFAGTGLITTVAVTGSGVITPPALSASPGGMALDPAGNVLVADNNNHRVVRFDPNTGHGSVVAGTGTYGFSGDGGPATLALLNSPFSVAVDSAGNLFIADSGNNRIRRVDAQTGIIMTIAGSGAAASSGDGGPAPIAGIYAPLGIALDSSGNVFIGEERGSRVRRIDAVTGVITTVAGNGSFAFTPDGALAASSSLNMPGFIAFDKAGNLLICEMGAARIRQIDANGILHTLVGNGGTAFTGDGVPAATASVGPAGQPAMDPAGNLYFPAFEIGRVFRVDAATGVMYTIGGNGNTGPSSSSGDGGPATSASIPAPMAALVLPDGDLMVSDGWAYSVRRISLPSPYLYTSTSISGPPSQIVGQPVTVTATVTPVGPSAGTPTGSVQFWDRYYTLLGTAPLVNGVASAALNSPGSVTAWYLGDSVYATSTSAALVVPLRVGTTVSLSASANTAGPQQPVTFTATVTPTTNTSYQPSGTVQLLDGTNVIGSASISNGTAQFTVSFASAGSHSLTAAYSGDSNFASGMSAPLNESITAQQTTVLLSSSAPSSTYGQTVQFTAAVSPAAATGTVQFLDGSMLLGSAALSAGTATLNVSTFGAGAHTITALYSGDSNYAASTSAPFVQNMAQATPTFTLTSSLNPSIAGQAVTLTVTMTPLSNGGGLGLDISQPPANLQATWSAGQTTITTSQLSAGTHAVTGTWTGDANIAAATSAGLNQVVKAQASGSVTSSANPSTLGSPVTFTASVSPATATGTVAFWDYGTSTTNYTVLGSATLSGGTVTFTTSALALGTHNIAVNYAGDSSNAGFTSALLAQVVNQLASTVTVTSSENPTVLQRTLTIAAAVTSSGSFNTPATGTVQLIDGTTTIASATLQNGSAQFSVSFSSPGAHALTVSYAGDTNYLGSTSAVFTETVNTIPTTTTMGTSVNPSNAGQALTLTATVAPAAATGSVQFMDGSAYLATATLTGGSASWTTSALPAGNHSLTAVYSGDANYAGGTSAVFAQLVKAASTVTVQSSGSPSTYGQNVQFTAAVSPSSATGTMQFFDGSTALGTATVSAGTASVSVSTLAAGVHNITATYSGDANDTAATSASWPQSVSKAATTANISASQNPSGYGQSVTMTANVSPSTATGTVQFLDGSTVLGTVTLNSGSASLAVSTLAAGTHTLQAAYSGDSNYSPVTSSLWTQTVTKAVAAVGLSASPNPSAFGQSVTLTAGISPPAATGTVQFLDGSTVLGTATVSGGTASLAVSTLAVGPHSLSAAYSGDSNYAGAASGAWAQTVAKGASAVSLSASPNPSVFGQAVTFTATVSPSSATGSVQFFDGSTSLGSAGLSGGRASLAVSTLALGSHSITGIYSGDASYATSTSPALTQTVNAAPPGAPANLTATAVSSSQINLSWAASPTGGVIYSVYSSNVSGFAPSAGNRIVAGVSGTSYSVTGLAASSTHYYLVTAQNSAGESAASNQASATTQSGLSCHVAYNVSNQWNVGFTAGVTIKNTGSTTINGWALTWTWPGNQQITQAWNSNYTQNGANAKLTNASWNPTIAPGATLTGVGFNGSYSGSNPAPTVFYVNGTACH